VQPLPTQAAPPVQETPAAETTTVSRWYGAPLFLADGAAYTAMIGGYRTGSTDLAIGGVATYVLDGPITHLVYGHPERVGQSVLVRLIVPLGAALYSASDCEGSHEECGKVALALGGFVLPTLSATRDGAVLGAVGLF
jgi:hypothetical protein